MRPLATFPAHDVLKWYCLLGPLGPPRTGADRPPAERAVALGAVLEPLEQANMVEHVLARRAALLGQVHVLAHDGPADGALAVSLEQPDEVSSEGDEPVDDVVILRSVLV